MVEEVLLHLHRGRSAASVSATKASLAVPVLFPAAHDPTLLKGSGAVGYTDGPARVGAAASPRFSPGSTRILKPQIQAFVQITVAQAAVSTKGVVMSWGPSPYSQ